ncbi:MAG: hypothetical protein PHT91_00955, partial [Candidatus Nanoarchaeia archaeon]|nr:hypothetical protein [Candidatus Nanoarchaeia archaeon]
ILKNDDEKIECIIKSLLGEEFSPKISENEIKIISKIEIPEQIKEMLKKEIKETLKKDYKLVFEKE